ncbi:Uncharacterized protein OBRU01_18582 [Operophtera brumata]|uniref:Uncharacterized protein n=1 Tax=Operophtera brumata TaxID=104452 RepID=A0A0L7KYD1_OPEBR|nr:Uncharacterized protein OBRU01_18582 [Operophtera brumata]
MSDHKKRFESMLFDHVTTAKTDYQYSKINPHKATQYQGKGSCLRVRPRPLKDINTMTDWLVPNIPFDIFGKPKDVVRTNPNEVQKCFTILPDHERKKIQETRPRLVITPAVSQDNMADGPRKFLLDNVYKTSNETTMHDVLVQANYEMSKNVRAPFPGLPAPANPVSKQNISLLVCWYWFT